MCYVNWKLNYLNMPLKIKDVNICRTWNEIDFGINCFGQSMAGTVFLYRVSNKNLREQEPDLRQVKDLPPEKSSGMN